MTRLMLAFILLVSLLFISCVPEETYQVQDINYQNKAEVYGNWKWNEYKTGLLSDTPVPFFYVLDSVDSYYLSWWVQSDSSMGYIFIGKIQWNLEGSRTIAITPSWDYLTQHLSMVWDNCNHPINGMNYCIHTVSNVDSLSEAVRRFREIWIIDDGVRSYESNPFIDTLKTAISNDVVSKGERYLRTVTDSCYQANFTASSLDNYCRVTEYQKIPFPELDFILANVDTLSSTEIWKTLEEKANR